MNRILKSLLSFGFSAILVAAIAFWAIGNPFAGAGERATVVSDEAYTTMRKSADSDGKRLSLVGTLSVSEHLTVVVGEPVLVALQGLDGRFVTNLPIQHGMSSNHFYVPRKFDAKDLTVYDNAGKEHAFDEPVQISFTLKRDKASETEQNIKAGELRWRYEQLRIDPRQ